jgi:hypothetical protein
MITQLLPSRLTIKSSAAARSHCGAGRLLRTRVLRAGNSFRANVSSEPDSSSSSGDGPRLRSVRARIPSLTNITAANANEPSASDKNSTIRSYHIANSRTESGLEPVSSPKSHSARSSGDGFGALLGNLREGCDGGHTSTPTSSCVWQKATLTGAKKPRPSRTRTGQNGALGLGAWGKRATNLLNATSGRIVPATRLARADF